ncbi:MAG: MMPL family transporter [Gammaproteobacteria bacterium]|nr:MMPL family transporter [Gammaproteobacteria bacterium]NIR85760.1 MMPL family transporter [Gammaproteobacteria bacterium]NIR90293.1 MMPL family transporter [Gammaproteobacteria bacterium]NIU06894.1 MMPL family transporter [Gammaproteobacteria bacterium]NIV53827.1 MMPL family transporter [Gammaproteobacteria bacterium]
MNVVTRLARWIALAWALGTALALYYTAHNLGVHTDTADMVSAELPFRRTLEAYEQRFPQLVDQVVVVIDGVTPEASRSAARELTARLEAEDEIFDSVFAPGVEPFFERHGLLYMSPGELEELADRLAGVQPYLGRLTADQSLRGVLALLADALQAVREGTFVDLEPILERVNKALQTGLEGRSAPLSWQSLMMGAEEGLGDRRQFILLEPRLDYASLFPAEPALQTVRRHAQALGIDDTRGVRLRLTGGIVLDHQELQSASRGAGIAALGALLMVIAILWIGLRSLVSVAAALLTLLSGLALTAAFAAAAVGHLNLISVAFAVLYIGLGIDFAIHVCMRYRGTHAAGVPHPSALHQATGALAPSLTLCAVTTALAFYSFVPTHYAGVAELGLISGTGMFIGLVSSLILLPALLHLWRSLHSAQPALGRAPEWLAGFPTRHQRGIRRATLALSLGSLALLPLVRFDHNPLNLQDPDNEGVATLRDLAANSEASPWSAVVLAPDAASTRALGTELGALETVHEARELFSFIPENQDEKLGIIDDMRILVGPLLYGASTGKPALEDQREAIRSALANLDAHLQSKSPRWADAIERLRDNLLALQGVLEGPEAARTLSIVERNLVATLPESLRLLDAALEAGPVGNGDLPPELVRRWLSADGTYRIEVVPGKNLADDMAALREFVGEVRTVAPEVTGESVLVLEYGDAVLTSFRQALLIAVIMVVVVLGAALRSADAVLVLAPLIVATLLTCACLVLLGIPLNYANIIALPLLLGIGVDNGIHMMREIRNPAVSRGDLLRTSTARAVLFSALTTVFSFGSLSFSAHPGAASMGQLLTIGVLLTLTATLIVLPALAGRRRS